MILPHCYKAKPVEGVNSIYMFMERLIESAPYSWLKEMTYNSQDRMIYMKLKSPLEKVTLETTGKGLFTVTGISVQTEELREIARTHKLIYIKIHEVNVDTDDIEFCTLEQLEKVLFNSELTVDALKNYFLYFNDRKSYNEISKHRIYLKEYILKKQQGVEIGTDIESKVQELSFAKNALANVGYITNMWHFFYWKKFNSAKNLDNTNVI
jgi:hypothetical protein